MLLRNHPDGRKLRDAFEDHIKHAVIPLIYDHGEEGIDQKGSGILLEHANRVFLLSSQHTFRGMQASRIKIPYNFIGGETFISLSPTAEDIFVSAPDDDVILIRLPPAAERLARWGWQIIPSAAGNEPPLNHPGSEDRQFVIAGYPSVCVIKDGDKRLGVLLSSYLEVLDELPEVELEPVKPESDFFLFYSNEGIDRSGAKQTSPRLHGVSGAAACELAIPEDTGAAWSPSGALTLVGLQSSSRYEERGFARTKRWNVIKRVLDQVVAQT